MTFSLLAFLHVADHESESIGVTVLVTEVYFDRLNSGVARSDDTELLVLVQSRDDLSINGLHVEVPVLLCSISIESFL